jgi:tetracycline resistance efflux pump
MNETWLSLLPPVVVLFAGFFTHRVLFSLFLGIALACLIATDFSVIQAAVLGIKHFVNNLDLANYTSAATFWDSTNSFICIFLFCLSIIITLISRSGGTYAYGAYIEKRIKSARSAEMAALMLSFFLFVDDYFSSLTVGAVMKPITDRFRVPRVKLAFLVDAMAAPLAIIAPISSWVSAIVGFLSENGFSDTITSNTLILADPFSAYTRLLPFVSYTFILMASSWFIVMRRISFGSMKKFEQIAQKTGNVHGGKEGQKDALYTPGSHVHKTAAIKDFIIPVFILIGSVLVGIIYSGGYYLFGGTRSLLGAFQNTQVHVALFIAGLWALFLVISFFLMRGKLHLKEILPLSYDGIVLMLPAVTILLFAWTFGDILRVDLKTGQFLAKILFGVLSIKLLPFLFFLVSSAISFALGSSWGTAALMFPIAIPMVLSTLGSTIPAGLESINPIFPVLGAILSGSVFGDHISPISDTTIMSSTSSGCEHIDHVRTQMQYVVPMFVGTATSFLCTGFLPIQDLFWLACASVGVGIAISLAMLVLFNAVSKKRAQ